MHVMARQNWHIHCVQVDSCTYIYLQHVFNCAALLHYYEHAHVPTAHQDKRIHHDAFGVLHCTHGECLARAPLVGVGIATMRLAQCRGSGSLLRGG